MNGAIGLRPELLAFIEDTLYGGKEGQLRLRDRVPALRFAEFKWRDVDFRYPFSVFDENPVSFLWVGVEECCSTSPPS